MEYVHHHDWCCIFCCPPCPNKIVSKLAFYPPKPASYYIINKGADQNYSVVLTTEAEWLHTEDEKNNNLQWFFTKTSKGSKIACVYIKCVSEQPTFTILFSHGSGVDLGIMCSIYYELGCNLNCNIISYDYSGYGMSTGKPTEKNLYADIDAVWNIIQIKYKIDPETLILYGQSIGTVPTIDLASKYKFAGVILHGTLMSGLRIPYPNLKKTLPIDAFPNIDKVEKIQSKVLVIHGTNDEIIDFSHGLNIYKRCPVTVTPLWVHGGGHDDIELYDDYLNRLVYFINFELLSNNTGRGGGDGGDSDNSSSSDDDKSSTIKDESGDTINLCSSLSETTE